VAIFAVVASLSFLSVPQKGKVKGEEAEAVIFRSHPEASLRLHEMQEEYKKGGAVCAVPPLI